MKLLRRLHGVREVLIDALEIRDDRAAECGDAVENEEIEVSAGREFVIEEDVDALAFAGAPGHLARQSVRRCRTGGHDIGLVGAQPAVEDDIRAGRTRLLEQTAIERAVFRAASNEPAIRFAAADHASDSASVVERGPIGGSKIEVPLDADAIQKAGHRLAFGCGLDDLQVTDESRSHIGFRFMHFNRSSGACESDCRRETGWARAGDSDRAVILHSRGMLSRHVGSEFR